MKRAPTLLVLVLAAAAACGDDGGDGPSPPSCDPPAAPALGDPDGHPQPLGAGPGQARAGRITSASQLPATTYGLEVWEVGDFVLANDRVAMVIEDVDHSDLYDPWGGRPVGAALVAGGALTTPADFGELFFLVGRSTIVTEAVTVVNDGADGGPAIVRASGRLAPIPFLDSLLGGILTDDLRDLEAAIDYTLTPGHDAIDVHVHLVSPRTGDTPSGTVLHGFMYTKRMPAMVPGLGFSDEIGGATWVQLIDDDGASLAYRAPDLELGGSLSASGFIGALNPPYDIPRCAALTRHHARIVIGGPGLDGLEQARAREEGRTLRAITGTVTGVAPGAPARVHAVGAGDVYLTRAPVAEDGSFTVHVPADGGEVTLTAVQPGGALASTTVAAGATTATIALPPPARVAIAPVTEQGGGVVPARVQLLPVGGGGPVVDIPDRFGEPEPPGARAAIEFSDGAAMTLSAPAGRYRLVVSRGPEYELYEETLDLVSGQVESVAPVLRRVVDTSGVQCGDFHIHTMRSNDASDDALTKVKSAMSDGVEILVRSDHEWVDSFAPVIEDHGYEPWAMAVGSIEMTSFQLWGHMGVFPLEPDPTRANAGAPLWQEFPSADDPDRAVTTLSPKTVFDRVRARPEQPTIIINHPHGGSDYFGYVGLDPATGLVAQPDAWDEEFTLVEVFNDSGWTSNRSSSVADWFAILKTGRPLFAVGSSDSHSLRSSPVGYPRTCIALGEDDPRQITPALVRDRLAAGHATVSGGVYLDVAVGTAGPGETARGVGPSATVDIRVQAASWIDVDRIEIVVDGETVDTIDIEPDGGEGGDPVVRWDDAVAVNVAAGGSWIVVAAYGDQPLEPVHPGRLPFAVSNPIFVER